MNSGDNNLFNPAFSTGDLSKISFLVRIGQMLSIWAVSITGFSITVSVTLRMSAHALYATNTEMWDRVDQVHKQKMRDEANKIRGSFSSGGGGEGNEITAMLGFCQALIYSFLPNIKAITVFDKQNVDPKTFFTTAVPVACLYLFIGVFVYYGYTTRIGEKVSIFGTELLDNFFLRVDPIEWASKIPGKIARVELATDGSQLPFDKQVNTVSRKAVSSVFSALSDVTKEKQIESAKSIESWVIDVMNTDPRPFSEPDDYKMSVTSTVTVGEPDLQYIHKSKNDNKGTITFAYCAPLTQFDTGSVLPRAETDWVRIVLTFEKRSKKDTTKSVNCKMQGGTVRQLSNSVEIDLGSNTDAKVRSVGGQGKLGSVMVLIEVNGNTLTLKPKGSDNIPSNMPRIMTDVAGLSYECDGKTHSIKEIEFNNQTGTSIKFNPINSDTSAWNWGENPGKTEDSLLPEEEDTDIEESTESEEDDGEII